MRLMTKLLILILSTSMAHAESLRFVPNVQNDALAEEAIALLHCLSENSGASWEISDSLGAHYLQLKEEGGALVGEYRNGERRHPLSFRPGEADEACRSVFPESESAESEPEPELPREAPPEKRITPWVWAGLGAALVGGFLLWKSKPDYRSLRME